ncbi:succinate dehydrogenase/Fumarate reductase transmembrane subunit [Variibacter gotjawalensis]|uniref:Succinate dehydrogenase/Fumarate reductase transmembrane subunit n=1 Tax=Variibacter gotjawalensis TaxID=1333996 RepID=A0A0S3PPC8_9BRAD|nr:succinate dehydrogenase [Variibacter gotjawalensis]NIK47923.1 fumarate reductase subunit C [Variibacter gotjawalensis]RZS49801.1 fumarate reductase subunit C [Variibacter gotjawalensis]BAT57630.1 succinate dehydrogenase/Fumarate reductase transmembrane subunit [Variibacter gotjawalensis]
MNAVMFLAQRLSAGVLGIAIAVHLGTILYAVRGGLTAGEILGRTQGNLGFALFYAIFVVAVAVHAPIGLRNIVVEWTRWRGRSLDIAMACVMALLLWLGLRAVYAVYA